MYFWPPDVSKSNNHHLLSLGNQRNDPGLSTEVFRFLLQSENHCAVVTFSYLAVRGRFSAGAGWSLSFHLGGRLGNPDPHKVDDMVQIGEEIGAREPAVMAVLLNAGLLWW